MIIDNDLIENKPLALPPTRRQNGNKKFTKVFSAFSDKGDDKTDPQTCSNEYESYNKNPIIII